MEGKAKIQTEDIKGNVAILEELNAGDIFGESSISTKSPKLPINIWSIMKTTVIFIDYNKIMSICPTDCEFHRRLVRNTLEMMAGKLITVNQKVAILQNQTIREKLMAFFETHMELSGSRRFSISLNRSALAEYIGTNRSALSRELCNMRNEGLIEFERNTFYVKRNDTEGRRS